eukprot:1168839-Pyramimonas_sp.AAC.1
MPELDDQPELKTFCQQLTTDPQFNTLQQMLAKHVKVSMAPQQQSQSQPAGGARDDDELGHKSGAAKR